MESRIVKIYIPRILGNVNKNLIVKTFDILKIGKVFYIDIHNRVNENNNPYYFAFAMVQLYNTYEANVFYNSLFENNVVRIFYDIEEAKFWEVKKHVEIKDRGYLSCKVKDTVTKAPAFMTLKWFVDKYNKHVVVSGLDGDSNRALFGDIVRLIPMCDTVDKLKAYCCKCSNGTLAPFTKKTAKNKSNQVIDIGGIDKYEPVCRYHYFN
jgi:hypothetical protein